MVSECKLFFDQYGEIPISDALNERNVVMGQIPQNDAIADTLIVKLKYSPYYYKMV